MKRVLKWAGALVGVLVVLVILAGAGVYFSSQAMMDERYDIEPAALEIPAADSAVLAEGRHLAQIHGCPVCHGENLGGHVYADVPPFRIVGPNLTPGRGGVGAAYTDADWVRALRHGVGPAGRPLLVMPSAEYTHLNERELGVLVAYLKHLEPVDNELPPSELRAVGRAIMVASDGALLPVRHIDHDRPVPATIERAATAEYGAYLAQTSCVGCHGADLQGGPHPDPNGPAVPSLVAAAAWPLDAFRKAIRTGVTMAGLELDPHYMPWTSYRHMTDEEIEALHLYIRDHPSFQK